MDLSAFTVKDILVAAIKSEIESRDLYLNLKNRVKNFILKNKFEFLSQEEEKHRVFFERLFEKGFPGETISLPEKSPVPIPEIRLVDENQPISEILEMAMEAELKASEFYKSMIDKFKDEAIKKTLEYISTVELSHYKLLEVERDYAKKYEDYEGEWPLFHVGP
ncbi:MAG TPA: ferritin family protein [Candidatus Hydrothermia bacterium]|nr:ferritin family protein [Candidatus Hydrothermae bacterium]MDD3649479.1 ferritin family protein [Candidatus Hydrothermia bacterium]MDD5572832.1 ferritin family protein [Candidatus Hydrothermia bacterium]HOK22802.1 ferritin family protein [Candidatus Hydrothermia bacterium]HOL23511.1 ferritin family protein [Candidatus Hydrothermia bacterium]